MIAGATIKNPRPELNLQAPDELSEMVRRATQLASRPNAASQQTKTDINQGTADAISTVQSSTDDINKVLQAVASIQQGEDQAMIQQGIVDANNQRQAEGMAQQALGTKAAFEADAQRAEFEWNEAGKYRERQQAKSALLGAGLQNIHGGLEDMVSANLYKKLFMTA